MSNNIRETLSDLIAETKDGDWGLEAPADGYVAYRIIRGADFPAVRRGDVSAVPLRYLSAQTVGRRTLQSGDILIETAGGSRDRSTGRTLFISEYLLERVGGPVTCASFARFLRIDSLKADPKYVYWYLQNLHAAGAMWEHQVQHTGVARFQYTRFAATHEISLPSRYQQEAVSDILTALDDKIAANDRIAEIADELIRQRYADESSRANEMTRIDDLGLLVRDQVPAEALSGDDSYIGLEHMPRRKIWLADWESSDVVTSAKTRFRCGDVLFGKLRPYFHKVGIAFVDGVSSTDILVIRAKAESVRGWLLAALSSDEVVGHASAVGDGTRMPRAKWSDLADYRIPRLAEERAVRFNDFVMPLVERVGSAIVENHTLAELRDTLLPKLMSGEIRVRDAEKAVEDVT